jgi:superfamily II DNA or RNA helicase
MPKLLGALGQVIYRVKTQLLVDRGVLARPTVRLATVTQMSARPTWQGVYGECVVRGASRNQTLVSLARRATKPGFLFVQQVEHGKALAKMLINAGIKADFVWGSHSLAWRKSHIRRLVQGHFDVLVCSSVFQEGIDVPELRSVIVGSGGKSVIATLQRLGRGMRVERRGDGSVVDGGDRFEVWDIADRGNDWLQRHARERLNAYTGEGFETFIEPEGPAALVSAR